MNSTTITAAIAALLLAAPAGALGAERVSVSSAGAQGNAQSGYAPPGRVAVSASGNHVAFTSDASNLVGGDTDGASDVFLRSRAGTTTLVSRRGLSAFSPAMSHDGFAVAYVAVNGTLPRGYDRATGLDVFVFDWETHRTVRVSRRYPGARDRRVLSEQPAVSGYGAHVAYVARRLTHHDVTPLGLFVYDTNLGRTTRVGRAGPDVSTPTLSDDGSRIAFFTRGDTRTRAGIYVFDRHTGRMLRVLATRSPGEPEISADGRHVVYEQLRHGAYRLFVHNLRTGRTRRAGAGVGASISAHGGRIAFQTATDGLIGSEGSPVGDVVVRDVRTGAERIVSTGPDGHPAGHSGFPGLSPDGGTVAFASSAALTSDDTNGVSDVFTEDLR